MKSIKAYYVKRGFNIVGLRVDHKFEPDQAALTDMELELNTSVSNKHVPDIECLNRAMKERILSVCTELIRVYGRIPGGLVCKLVYDVTFCLSSFPAKYGISDTLSSQDMINSQSVEFKKHGLIEF